MLRVRAALIVSFVLLSAVLASGTVAAQETTQITGSEGLQDVREDLGGDYVLADDIDLSDDPNFEPIGDGSRGDRGQEPFTGTFDGNGHNISGLSIVRSDESYVGLFGEVGRDGEVTGVGLEGVEIEGGERVGGVAGFNRGNITDSYVDGTVSGERYIGGVVGWNRWAVTRSYSLASVSGRLQVGGVAGRNDGGGTVSQTYAAGTVSATGGRVGGLVGNLGFPRQREGDESVLRNSYWDTDATGQSEGVGRMRAGDGEVTVENVEGLTTSEMQGNDADERMTAFDFAGTWDTTEDYPVLSWQTGLLPTEDIPLRGFGALAAIGALLIALSLRHRGSSDR